MKRKKGFTLIELLVVIAIIALLMFILMPALGKAKELAKSTVCKVNLHSWSLIWYLYTEDYNGKFPQGNYGPGQVNWYNKVASYYEGNADIRFCPTAKKNNAAFPFSSWDRTDGISGNYDEDDVRSSYASGSYGMNDYIHTPTGTGPYPENWDKVRSRQIQ